jgi:choline dehydrogenase-like flavoprotein
MSPTLKTFGKHAVDETYDFIICGGGTTGCTLATRLVLRPSRPSVLLLEAGLHNSFLEFTSMPLGWTVGFDISHDWNLINKKSTVLNDREVKLSRGRYLGGCSGCNGTLCVRGVKEDFDDWNMEGWPGDEVWGWMNKVGDSDSLSLLRLADDNTFEF